MLKQRAHQLKVCPPIPRSSETYEASLCEVSPSVVVDVVVVVVVESVEDDHHQFIVQSARMPQ